MQKVHVVLVDDLDEGEADETVTFAVDGVTYEIDLSTDHADELRTSLTRFIEAGRRVAGKKTTKVVGGRKVEDDAGGSGLKPDERGWVRAWANANGYSVSDRGRIAAVVIEAWQEAGSPRD